MFSAKYSSVRSDGKNCCVSEFRYPQQNALCDGAKVILVKNFAVELGLMTGTVGVVKQLCYKHANGSCPDDNDDELQYVIVDFPDCLISENSKFFEDLPRTYIPIPIVEEMCEEKCCSVRALPLRCCNALSKHKRQGMSGNDPFECVTVHYPTNNTARMPGGLELVAKSRLRLESLDCVAIGNRMEEDLIRQQLTSIGRTKAYDA